ncbi:MAG: transporter ATP-binding protein [Verrucomicrobia bacterium]|nr:transporter ATP-binding protein [Verrucomicrobiota bacterium]
MADLVITAEGLGKRYQLAHESRPDTFRDSFLQSLRGFARGFSGLGNKVTEDFWALKDVSFSIERGEVTGIIGRNGAGKSTLLKLLARITEPTTGRITLRGRVASLLEVGTGFHQELSGRENIFLNGAILGMSRREIRRKFDEIVAFAEVERFLDTPVKHYSSGMYVRLAFSVAAHLEPEILIVDEVLAVGDGEFQKKCLGRMDAISRTGRTVLFVSHNLEALRSICSRGLLLESGVMAASGPIQDVIARYHLEHSELSARFPASDKPSITGVEIDGARLQAGDLVVKLTYQSPWPLRSPVGGFVLSTADGRPIFGSSMRTHPPTDPLADSRAGTCTWEVPQLALHSGNYSLSAWLGDKAEDFDQRVDAVSFAFVSPRHYPGRPPVHTIGPVDLPCRWTAQS